MNAYYLASHVLVPAFFFFALVCALAGTVLAVGLIAAEGTTLRFVSRMNAWVPMRQHMKWAEVPHDTGQLVLARRNWFAAAFILGGAFILISVAGYLALASPPVAHPGFMRGLVLEMLMWLMVAGGVLAVVVGLMLAAAPATLARIEAYTDRWISTRKSGRAMEEGGDRMHSGLDRLVAHNARHAGWILLVFSTAGVASAAWALLAR